MSDSEQGFIDSVEFRLDWNLPVSDEELKKYYKEIENNGRL